MAGKPRWLVAVLAAAALTLTACTNEVQGTASGVEIGPLTTGEATAAALSGFAEAAAVRYQGGLTASDGSALTVDVTATSSGEVFGTVAVEGLGASIVVLDKTLFLKGAPEFWSAMAVRFGVTSSDGTALGNRWVKLPTVLLGVEFADIFTPDVVSQTAGEATENADEELSTKTTTVGSVQAVEVPVDGGTAYLAKDAPHGVVSLALDEIGTAENTKAKKVTVTVTDVSATVNKIYTDLAAQAKNELGTAVDALTSINQGGNRFDACGAPSCTLVVDVTNPSKKAVKVHLRADWTGDNAPLGSCEQVSEPVAPGASLAMSCAITTPEWVSFFQRANSVPGTHPYGAVWTALALADPPDVAALEEKGAAQPADPEKAQETDSGHAVYEISSADGVWKYGVVPARYWRDQAKDQLRSCLGITKSVCTYSLVTTAENQVSAYALVNQLLATYAKDGGKCPPGQWVSCAR
jgi:predicted small secreted protein